MAPYWDRGLLRLWIVLSIVWLVAGVALLIPPLIRERPVVPERGTIELSLKMSGELRNGDTPPERKGLYEEALRRGLLLSIQPMADHGGMLEITLQGGTKITNVPVDADAADVESRIGKFLSREWDASLRDAIAIILVPVLGVLVIGIAVRWIVRGFAPKT